MSYDFVRVPFPIIFPILKGHQIIGELRPRCKRYSYGYLIIEGSPDHWWVTTVILHTPLLSNTLKGHQIIGELRLFYLLMIRMVNWRVTRSLVSYDGIVSYKLKLELLKGHQIIGELRLHWFRCGLIISKLKGHQIIGELRLYLGVFFFSGFIEGSPDHWWVTTHNPLYWADLAKLKGHQIIGELRLHRQRYQRLDLHWRVTRSLVSYDQQQLQTLMKHLIEGSPDHWWVTTLCSSSVTECKWLKGHQIIGELRLNYFLFFSFSSIEGSPDHWWVTT